MVEVYNSLIHLFGEFLSPHLHSKAETNAVSRALRIAPLFFFCFREDSITTVYPSYHRQTKCSPPSPPDIRSTLDSNPPRKGAPLLRAIVLGASPSSFISAESRYSLRSVGLQASKSRNHPRSRCRRRIREVALVVEAFLRLRRSMSRALLHLRFCYGPANKLNCFA